MSSGVSGLMSNRIRGFIVVLASALAAQMAFAPAAFAQSQRGQPKTPFSTRDFAKVHWLEGRWVGTAPGESPLYEQFRFVDDSTAEITYYRDPQFTQEAGSGKLYLSVGRVYHTFGPNRWGATHVDADGLFFVPQTNARIDYAWTFVSPDQWTATMRTGVGGHPRVTVYHMERVK